MGTISTIFSVWGQRTSPIVQRGPQRSYPETRRSGIPSNVTFDPAMSISAFWACVRLISETIGSLPIKAFDVNGDELVLNTDNEIWRLLNFRPNRYQTRNEFFESIGLNLSSSGNFYGRIERFGNQVISIMPLNSAQVLPELQRDGSIVYCYTNPNGIREELSDRDVWHVKLFGNGIVGLSPLSYAGASVNIARESENQVGASTANGGKPTGVLTIDHIMNKVERDRDWETT